MISSIRLAWFKHLVKAPIHDIRLIGTREGNGVVIEEGLRGIFVGYAGQDITKPVGSIQRRDLATYVHNHVG